MQRLGKVLGAVPVAGRFTIAGNGDMQVSPFPDFITFLKFSHEPAL